MAQRPAKELPLSPTATYFSNAQKGDPEALSDLVKRIHDRLYRFCLYLTGNVQAAQDLCQEAYIKVMENIQTLDNPRHFVRWLFVITRNHFLDYVRSPKNKGAIDLSIFNETLSGEGRKNEMLAQLMKSMSGLSAEDRLLLLLVCLEGETYAEAAEVVGTTEEAVRCKIYRLRKTFNRKDFFTGAHK